MRLYDVGKDHEESMRLITRVYGMCVCMDIDVLLGDLHVNSCVSHEDIHSFLMSLTS